MKKILLLSFLCLVALTALSAETITVQLVTSVDESGNPTFGDYWVELLTDPAFIGLGGDALYGETFPAPLELVTDGTELYLFRMWFAPVDLEPEIVREEFAVATGPAGYQQGYSGTYKHWDIISYVNADELGVDSWVHLTAPNGLEDSVLVTYEQIAEDGTVASFTFFGSIDGEFVAPSGDPAESADQ